MGDNVKAKYSFNDMMREKSQEKLADLKQEFAAKMFKSSQTATSKSVTENFDIENQLQQALIHSSGVLSLANGADISIDERAASIIIEYTKIISAREKKLYLHKLINNERDFMKSLEFASHELDR
jgi:glucan phosphoethanolaminetransferase (alkaline phosphatase superfamily)